MKPNFTYVIVLVIIIIAIVMIDRHFNRQDGTTNQVVVYHQIETSVAETSVALEYPSISVEGHEL